MAASTPDSPGDLRQLLEFDTLRILVRCNRKATLTWLKEFLAPSFNFSSAPGAWEFEVNHTVDPDRYREYRTRCRRKQLGSVDLFIMDGENIQLPLWQGSGQACVLNDVSEQIILLSETEPSISIICNEDKGDSRKMLMRVIRELTMYHCFQEENLIMHAAAARSEQGGIMLTGPKNSGKTSLLLGMLESNEYCYITNDRACMKLGNKDPTIRGIPTIVSVGKVTLTEGSQTKVAIAHENARYLLTTEERRVNHQGPKRENAKGNYTLSPLQFCAALECEMAAASPLTRIFVLKNSAAVEAPVFSDLSFDQAAVVLFGNSFNSMAVGSETVFSLVYGMGAKVSRDSLHQRCLEFAANIPCTGVTVDARRLNSTSPLLLKRFAQRL